MSGARHPSMYMLIDVLSIAFESFVHGLAASVFLVSKVWKHGPGSSFFEEIHQFNRRNLSQHFVDIFATLDCCRPFAKYVGLVHIRYCLEIDACQWSPAILVDYREEGG